MENLQRIVDEVLEKTGFKTGEETTSMKFETAIQKQIDRDRAAHAEHGRMFKERTVEHFTLGDLVFAVLAIDNEADALEFYNSYIEWQSKRDCPGVTAKDVVDANIGWCFGEGMARERIAMWARCTPAFHPILGRAVFLEGK